MNKATFYEHHLSSSRELFVSFLFVKLSWFRSQLESFNQDYHKKRTDCLNKSRRWFYCTAGSLPTYNNKSPLYLSTYRFGSRNYTWVLCSFVTCVSIVTNPYGIIRPANQSLLGLFLTSYASSEQRSRACTQHQVLWIGEQVWVMDVSSCSPPP